MFRALTQFIHLERLGSTMFIIHSSCDRSNSALIKLDIVYASASGVL